MSAQDPIAFFGATGGCANAALTLTLKAGHRCSALARTPNKLIEMLTSKGVPKQTLDNNLQIIQGDARDLGAVKKNLVFKNQPVVKIMSGIGMTPTLNYKKWDKTICQDSMRTTLQALRELNFEKKPFLAVISTTGISEGPEDVPFWNRFLYHQLLAMPHADKKVVDQLVIEAAEEGGIIDGYTLPRPSWLTDKPSIGMDKIRVGSVEQPAVGYTINRDDVGLWIFEELLKADPSKWKGKWPTITS